MKTKILDLPKKFYDNVNALTGIFLLSYGIFAGQGLIIYLLFSNYYLLGILYIIWVYTDRKTVHTGGRRFNFLRNLGFWKQAGEYMPLKLVKTCDLPSDKNYLFCAFPHGLVSVGIIGNFLTESNEVSKVFPGLTPYMAALDSFLFAPVYRELFIGLGGVASSKESLLHLLSPDKKGNIVAMMIGGAQEALYAKSYSYKLVLKNRKGFVKIAMKAGCPLVPVFSFGENELCDQVSNSPGTLVFRIQTWLKKLTGISFCIPKGSRETYYVPMPKRTPVTTVVGEPIEVPHIEDPEPEVVDKYHEIFMNKLIELFEKHKNKYLMRPDKTKLII